MRCTSSTKRSPTRTGPTRPSSSTLRYLPGRGALRERARGRAGGRAGRRRGAERERARAMVGSVNERAIVRRWPPHTPRAPLPVPPVPCPLPVPPPHAPRPLPLPPARCPLPLPLLLSRWPCQLTQVVQISSTAQTCQDEEERSRCLTELLVEILREPAFDQLRTKQQLGPRPPCHAPRPSTYISHDDRAGLFVGPAQATLCKRRCGATRPRSACGSSSSRKSRRRTCMRG